MQATKLPLSTWFLAICLIGQAKTEISSLELSRLSGANEVSCSEVELFYSRKL
jgi:hypothetical protein